MKKRKAKRTHYQIRNQLAYFKAVEEQLKDGYNISVKTDVETIPEFLTVLTYKNLNLVSLKNEPVYFCDSSGKWFVYQASSL